MTAAVTPRVMVIPLIHPPLETRQPRPQFHGKSNFKIFIHPTFNLVLWRLFETIVFYLCFDNSFGCIYN